MGILAFIVGLIVFLAAMFPNLAYLTLIPAVFGLIIGINKLGREGFCSYASAGTVLSGLAVVLALYWTAIISFATVDVMENIWSGHLQPQRIEVIYPQPSPAANAPAAKPAKP